uniref:Cyclin-dependent kinase 2 homolog n=1 Tax=Phytophthora ramorum TaxID=164328 RepID=H3G5N4_PHYRM
MNKYVVEKIIGEGTYGIVYKAKEKATGEYVAIKKFKTANDEQLSKREIQACSMLSHPNIVSYRNSFRHDGLLHLVFDYVCEGMVKLLSRNKKGVKPQEARRIIYQLCKALEYCHSNRIIHRDVKPDNILIDENGDIKLCDFGKLTVQFEGDPLSDYVSTRWYRPPEQELRLDRYSFDADVWSVGCVLMELLTGRPLFPGNTQIDQM